MLYVMFISSMQIYLFGFDTKILMQMVIGLYNNLLIKIFKREPFMGQLRNDERIIM